MTIQELVRQAKKPDLAKILMMHFLKLDEKSFFLSRGQELTPKQTKFFLQLCQRLEAGEPVQYITGVANFYSREFRVDENVLIPRPETEMLVQEAIKNYKRKKRRNSKIIDIGTGSGCVAISLAKEIMKLSPVDHRLLADFYAVDISESALKVASQNAKIHRIKLNFLHSNLFSNNKLPQKFDLVIANLPYLSPDYQKKLSDENFSIAFEPKVALDGGKAGLEIVKKLIAELPNHLEQNGIAILEVGDDQGRALKKFSHSFAKLKFEYLKDLAGRFRFLKISKINRRVRPR